MLPAIAHQKRAAAFEHVVQMNDRRTPVLTTSNAVGRLQDKAAGRSPGRSAVLGREDDVDIAVNS